MATIQEVMDEINGKLTNIDSGLTALGESQAEIRTDIADLKTQIESGSLTNLQTIASKLGDIETKATSAAAEAAAIASETP